jgi:Raf kinase inhibitor-like YbhB/YbcL family protein
MQIPRKICHCLTTAVYLLIFALVPAYSLGNTGIGLQSTSFRNRAEVPRVYTCSGQDKSPPLEWNGVPAGAKALVIIVRDPDAPGGSFVHWVLYDLPPVVSELPSGLPATESIPQGGRQGLNGIGHLGYMGPCPPPGAPHHYHFRLYAIDNRTGLNPGATAEAVERAIKGHVLGSGELVGIFAR